MNIGSINTDLAINKNQARKMAAEFFFKNKKYTAVNIYAYNVKVTLEYKGSRSDELTIRNNVEITHVFNKSK